MIKQKLEKITHVYPNSALLTVNPIDYTLQMNQVIDTINALSREYNYRIEQENQSAPESIEHLTERIIKAVKEKYPFSEKRDLNSLKQIIYTELSKEPQWNKWKEPLKDLMKEKIY